MNKLALLLPLLALAACKAENHASLKVAGICVPPDDPANCSFTATCDGQYIGRNVVDLSVTDHLWLIVQVNNQLPNNARPTDFRTNTNDAYVREAAMEFPETGLPDATAPILGSAVVPAGGSTVVSVLAVPESTGALVRTGFAGPDGILGTADDIVPAGSYIDEVAKMRLRGTYGDTTEFETAAFEIPMRICNGCLGALSCTAPDFLVACPPNDGQRPISAGCVTP